jgi:enoyl-CoA hydratase
MQSFRGVRLAASRLQPASSAYLRASSLGVSRSFSSTSRMGYEFIQVTEPRPGVGQGIFVTCVPSLFTNSHLHKPQ